MQGKVEICGVNTAKLKTLKSEEMTRLLKLAKAGDKEARDKLVEETCGWCCLSFSGFPDGERTRMICFRWAALAF